MKKIIILSLFALSYNNLIHADDWKNTIIHHTLHCKDSIAFNAIHLKNSITSQAVHLKDSLTPHVSNLKDSIVHKLKEEKQAIQKYIKPIIKLQCAAALSFLAFGELPSLIGSYPSLKLKTVSKNILYITALIAGSSVLASSALEDLKN